MLSKRSWMEGPERGWEGGWMDGWRYVDGNVEEYVGGYEWVGGGWVDIWMGKRMCGQIDG